MKMHLYGVMGSVSGGSSDLGSNTTCILITDNDKHVVFDAGSGLLNYMNDFNPKHTTIIFTHYHLDHILGLPFVKQLFSTEYSLDIYGPTLAGNTVKEAVTGFFKQPYLPMGFEVTNARITFNTIAQKDNIKVHDFEISSLEVNHPGGCFVYNVVNKDKKISILTDIPNGMENNDKLIEFCKDSNLIYYDTFFTDEELKNKNLIAFGHASIGSAIKVLDKSNSKKLLLGHHAFTRKLNELEGYVTEKVLIAIEGDIIEI